MGLRALKAAFAVVWPVPPAAIPTVPQEGSVPFDKSAVFTEPTANRASPGVELTVSKSPRVVRTVCARTIDPLKLENAG